MGTLNITEYERLHQDEAGNVMPVGRCDGSETHQTNVSFTTSAQSAAFGATSRYIRVVADIDAYLAWDSNPTATVNSTRVPAGTVEYFGVVPGQKVAAYDGSSS